MTTPSGVKLDLTYVASMDKIKEGMRCDGVEAREEGVLVGYIKFDYTSDALMSAEVPTIWAYASRYGYGLSVRPELLQPLADLSTDKLLALLEAINLSRLASADTLTSKAPERAREIWLSLNSYPAATALPSDRAVLLGCLKAAERSHRVKRIVAARRDFIDYASRPFVSYVNTSDNFSKQMRDNQGRGFGTILYRAASLWIAERGMAPGIYASKLQSEEAKRIWASFARRGWVEQDGDRQYLNAAKMVDR